ncbi:MAG: FAD-binding oxidoreductase [Mariprofundales bacterium]|nr:FAD-binding oxidoreductase [Mariprofundales bacterium]
MTTITFQEQSYDCNSDENVLACLTRHGLVLPSSCQSGVCQTCMMRATAGDVPEKAQQGLKPTQKIQGYFLACVCLPETDMRVETAELLNRFSVTVCEKSMLNADVACIRMTPPADFTFHPGQFINIIRDSDALARSYSLANVVGEALEIHVKRIPDGAMSSWLVDEVKVGDTLVFQGAIGDCFYLDNKLDQSMVMVGVSTGMAPLYGIVRDALQQGHRGQIKLYHASLASAGLYYVDELRALAEQYDNLTYTPCVLHGVAPRGGEQGKIDHIIGSLGDFADWRVFLCGDPPIVNALRQKTYLGGAHMLDIFSDPFEPSKS